MEKYFEPTYLVILVISIIDWLVSAVDLGSKLTALGIAVLTFFYILHKMKGQKLANEKLKEELKQLREQNESNID